MCKPIVQGVSVLGLLMGCWCSAAQAQMTSPYGTDPDLAQPGGSVAAAAPGTSIPWPDTAVRRASAGVPARPVAFQEPAPAMPTPTPAPAGPGPMTEPTSPNPAEITLPKAEARRRRR